MGFFGGAGGSVGAGSVGGGGSGSVGAGSVGGGGAVVAACHASGSSSAGSAWSGGHDPVVGRDSDRSRLATPVARSAAPVARRSANSGLGSRIAAIARQTGQTQHSSLPVAKPL